MADLRYPVAALRSDYIRAGLGLALSLGPALAVPLSSPADYLLVPAAGLFAIFGLRTWQRQHSRVRVDGRRISIFRRRQASLDWSHVRSVRLSYFSTRADRREGWMQLTLRGGDPQCGAGLRTIRVDSALDDFEHVARRAAAAIRANGLTISPTTRANFEVLGIDISEATAEPHGELAAAILRENG